MYELKKFGKVFTSKFVGTGPSSYEIRFYRAAVSQMLRNTDVDWFEQIVSKMLLTMNLLLLSMDWLMVAKTSMFV